MQSTPPVETPPGEPATPSEAPTVAASTEAPEAPEAAEPAIAQAPDEAAPVAPAAEAAAATPPSPPAKDLSPAATGARLAELFPALFVGPDGRGEWKAIKLRIHADIQARAPGEFSKRALGIFFSRYTTTTAYLKALAAPGAQRVDLDGQPAGEIAEEHRAAAAEEVARRQAIMAERRAAHRRPPPPAARDGEGPPAPRSDRPDRPARPERPPRPSRPAGPDDAPRRPRPPETRGPRDAERRPPAPRTPQRPDRGPRPELRPERRTEPAPAAVALPADPAQRERALLLKSFESSPLSKSNFCVLKRISEADLDTALALARQERQARHAG